MQTNEILMPIRVASFEIGEIQPPDPANPSIKVACVSILNPETCGPPQKREPKEPPKPRPKPK